MFRASSTAPQQPLGKWCAIAPRTLQSPVHKPNTMHRFITDVGNVSGSHKSIITVFFLTWFRSGGRSSMMHKRVCKYARVSLRTSRMHGPFRKLRHKFFNPEFATGHCCITRSLLLEALWTMQITCKPSTRA